MVHFEEHKIIIEIETPNPIEDSQTMQRALIDIISILDYEHIGIIQQNLFYVCMLINELRVDDRGLKSMFKTKDGRQLFKECVNRTYVENLQADGVECINKHNTPQPSKEKNAEIIKHNNQMIDLQKVSDIINFSHVGTANNIPATK